MEENTCWQRTTHDNKFKIF